MEWTPEGALQSLKKYLASPPILVPPRPREPLLLYIVATTQVVSGALVVEREQEEVPEAGLPETSAAAEAREPKAPGKWLVQRPVYFISTVLRDVFRNVAWKTKKLYAHARSIHGDA